MPVPILQLDQTLIASFRSSISDVDFIAFRDTLLERVTDLRVDGGVIIDVTEVDVLDSFATRVLRDLARMIRLRGACTVIVGIQPEVALAMVQLGLTFEDVPTALDLQEGLNYLNARRS